MNTFDVLKSNISIVICKIKRDLILKIVQILSPHK